MRTACLLPLFLCLLLAMPARAYTGRVARVRDGDSLSVHGPDNATVNLRLYGIDAPESRQPFGYQAKKRLSKLVSRQTVDVEPIDTDRYGRTVALVRLRDGSLVNEILVGEGLAWVYGQYCQRQDPCERLSALQDQARRQRRGLWVENNPQRPSDWRRENKTEEWYTTPVRAVKNIARRIKVVLHR